MSDIIKKVIIIGGGAAGLMAGYSCLMAGNQAIILEKNEKIGKKIYITGKGRCNVTNNVPPVEFLNNVVRNSKFLYGSIYKFSSSNTIEFLEKYGLEVKTERGNRVFPLSDKASDITKTFEKAIKSLGGEIYLNTEVKSLIIDNDKVVGVKTDKEELFCDSVVVCTGGVSYPLTGSTGDGYKFAKSVGHKIIELKPSLCGINLKGTEYISLQGLSLKNVCLTAFLNDKKVYSDFGELLFTHYGISGPIVLSCSCNINRLDVSGIKFIIDLKPALDDKTLDNRLVREFTDNNQKSILTVMRSLVPHNLIEIILRQASIKKDKCCSVITKEERLRLVYSLKNLTFFADSLRNIEEAVVTSGGVYVNEINPKTMESKIIKNLFFAGEVIDVDAYTGGFNLQIAFTTGFIAGQNA